MVFVIGERIIYIIIVFALFTAIIHAPSSLSPTPIVIPLKQHKLGNPKRVIETRDIFNKRQKGTVYLHDHIIHDVDTLYFGKISVGTPSTDIHVIFDTGSPKTWVTGWNCKVNDNMKRSVFNPRISSTAQGGHDSVEPIYARYADHTKIMAKIYTENVTIADLNVNNQEDNNSKSLPNIMVFWVWRILISESGFATFLKKLVKKGLVSHASFGFFFDRESHGETGSQLTIGGVNPIIERKLQYYPVYKGESWMIKLEEITINNKPIMIWQKALIDTGASSINGPRNTFEDIFSFIPVPEKEIISKKDLIRLD